ncbi:MAG TPA: hypothetical protein VK177_16000 [Flavobacteriales bacterium]|nr:hypothetical protein [Flavobacteriales bacterium]
MENYLLENVIEFKPSLCGNKTFLIVHKLHRTPYHIGLISGENYYALTINGKEVMARAAMLENLANKAYNNLLIEIKRNDAVEFDPAPYFENTELNHTDFVSCLYPVRAFLSALTSNNKTAEANNLFELLDTLQDANLAGIKMATRMNPIMEGKIVLQRYETADIAKYIKKLNENKPT